MKVTPKQMRELLARPGVEDKSKRFDGQGESLAIFLEIPPSTNALWLSTSNPKKPRVPTPEYRSWKERMLSRARQLKSPAPGKPFKIVFTLYGGDGLNLGSDVSNRIKAAEDLLVSAGVIPGDSIRAGCWGVSIEYQPRAEGNVCELGVQIISIDQVLPEE